MIVPNASNTSAKYMSAMMNPIISRDVPYTNPGIWRYLQQLPRRERTPRQWDLYPLTAQWALVPSHGPEVITHLNEA